MTARLTGIDPTGSAMDRVERCTASAALPQVFDANEKPDRDRGTAIHAFLDRVATLRKAGAEDPRATALAEVDAQWRQVCEDVELAKLGPQLEMSTEVAVAYNWREDTARILKTAGHRLYEIDPSCEIAATLDVVGAAPREVYIGDYKGPYGWLPDPHQAMQLGLGAVAIARVTKARRAQVEYIRILSDGSPRKFSASLDVFGLEGAAARIRGTMERVEAMRPAIEAGVVPNVTEGPWCRHCPARMNCPAKTSAMRAVLAPEATAISIREPITPDNAGRVYSLWREAKNRLSMIEGAIHAYAKVTPIPVGLDEDGSERFFGELRRPGNDVVDGVIAHQVLTKRYGGDAANTAVMMETTKKAIGDLARAHLQPGEKITKVIESIVEDIRAAGGIDNPETTTTTEYSVAPDGAAKARKRKAS